MVRDQKKKFIKQCSKFINVFTANGLQNKDRTRRSTSLFIIDLCPSLSTETSVHRNKSFWLNLYKNEAFVIHDILIYNITIKSYWNNLIICSYRFVKAYGTRFISFFTRAYLRWREETNVATDKNYQILLPLFMISNYISCQCC